MSSHQLLFFGLLLLAGLASHESKAQSPVSINQLAVSEDYILRTWDMEDGLPSNSISGIAQTPDGYLWVATNSGLSRFDGVRFVSLLKEEFVNLGTINVTAVAASRNGDLWVGVSRGGILRIRHNQCERLVPVQAAATNAFWVTTFSEDSSGSIWVSFSGTTKALCYKNGKLEEFGMEAGLRQGLRQGWDTTLQADSTGKIWFTNKMGCGFFDGNRFQEFSPASEWENATLAVAKHGGVWATPGNRLVLCHPDGRQESKADISFLKQVDEILVLCEGDSGDLWIGTRHSGLFLFHNGKFARVPTSDPSILSLQTDREGNLWVGTNGGGLDRLRRRSLFLHQRKDGLVDEYITSLCEDRNGTLWLAGRNAPLLHAVDDSNQRFVPINDELKGEGFLLALHPESDGGIWIATLRSGLWRSRAGRYFFDDTPQATALLVDREGNYWYATIHGNLYFRPAGALDKPAQDTGLAHARALAQDPQGCLWVGTEEGEVFRRMGGQFKLVPTPKRPGAFQQVRFIVPDGPNTVWIGKGESGLCRWQDGQAAWLQDKTGLGSDEFRALVIDPEGNFWFATRGRLVRVHRSELTAVMDGKKPALNFLTFGRDDGVPSIEFSIGFRNSAIRTRDGHIWFASYRGALEIAPELLPKPAEPVPVKIEQMSAGDRIVYSEWGKKESRGALVLEPHPGPVQIRFTLPELTSPTQVSFHYRLVGLRDEWVSSEAQRSVTYPSLPPGHYRFEVKGAEAGELTFKNTAALEFTVLAHWWETLAFRSVMALAAAVGISLLVMGLDRRRVRNQMIAKHAVELESANKELEAFAYSVSHDLRAPLRAISGFSKILQKKAGYKLDANENGNLDLVLSESQRMSQMIDDILQLSRISRSELHRSPVDLSALANGVVQTLKHTEPNRQVQFVCEPDCIALADHNLVRIVLENLIGNAWKYSSKTPEAKIAFGKQTGEDGETVYFVRDNGVGFDPQYAQNLFGAFQRLHTTREFPGTGIGLASVQRIIQRHGGKVWIEAKLNEGATANFTLPTPEPL